MNLPPFPFLPASPEERLRLTQYGELVRAMERAAFNRAMASAWEMVDPLRPSGQPGSYARGHYQGTVSALQQLRTNVDFEWSRAAIDAARSGGDGE